MSKRLVSLLLFGWLAISLEAWGQALSGPPLYVSTFAGHQILVVDGTTGATSVLFTDPNSDTLEGLAIGPDNLIYACAPENNSIIRVDQTGNNFASVLTSDTLQPEGPSFNTAGKLFFNTRGQRGVWDISFDASDTPSAPTQVIPAANGATDGEGTTFGALEQLLIVDRGSNLVLQSTAPPATSTLISSSLSTPIGIAVSAAGENFVASVGTQTIERFSSTGTHLGTYADFTFDGTDTSDHPFYLQFDASGVLYVVTAAVDGTAGKVWRVDPDPEVSGLGDPSCLVDLGAAYAGQIAAPTPQSSVTCLQTTVTGTLNSGDATGLAVPPTSITTPDQGVTAGTLAIFPFGNSTTEKMKVLYPAGSFPGTIQMFAKFTEISPATFFGDTSNLESPASLSANPSGKVCIPWANTGGNCIIAELECDPAPCPTTSGFDPNTTGSTHNSQDIQISATFVTNFPISNPDLVTADDNTFNYVSIFTDFYPVSIDPTIRGGTNGFNSDFVTTDDEITASSSPTTAANFLGFQTPLAPKNARVFKSGDTLAVRFTLSGLVPGQFDPTQVVARISVEMLSSAQNTNGANFKSIPNNQFVYNSSKNNYQFYLSLAGYASGNYNLLVTSNSFPVQQVTFSVH
ncbi:MAG TPA: hypothetical protein VG204_23155 [Terriglobia bacterium]|nr:hypothetical protein [Terriglobia bacterium]